MEATQEVQLQRAENEEMKRLMKQQFEECKAKSNMSAQQVDFLHRDLAKMTEQSKHYRSKLVQTLSDTISPAQPRRTVDSSDL